MNAHRTLYTFCRVCETRLHTPEEWGEGLCAFHAAPQPRRTHEDSPDWATLLKTIDALLEEPPTGLIPRPNRHA